MACDQWLIHPFDHHHNLRSPTGRALLKARILGTALKLPWMCPTQRLSRSNFCDLYEWLPKPTAQLSRARSGVIRRRRRMDPMLEMMLGVSPSTTRKTNIYLRVPLYIRFAHVHKTQPPTELQHGVLVSALVFPQINFSVFLVHNAELNTHEKVTCNAVEYLEQISTLLQRK